MTSAYIFFVKDQYPKISAQNPGLKMTELSKKIGQLWKTMSHEQKQPYQNQANEAPKIPRVMKADKKEKKEKKEGAVKRPLNAYMKFAQQNRNTVMLQNSTLKLTEVSSKLGQMWRALSESEKNNYKN